MKKKSVFARLFGYMGMFKITMIISICFAAISAVVNLQAFTCVYDVAKEIIKCKGAYSTLDKDALVEQGWRAVYLISSAFGMYGFGLLFSHITAFNTVARIRIKLIQHIGKLPLGYHSINPSGKQRKIIEKNTDNIEVLIAHQITASIDPENETKIQEAIGKLIQNKTVLIIAHKLRSIVDCDKIVVLKEGHIVEQGTHNKLMQNGGLYHRLYELQNESVNWMINGGR
ncbi:ABC transporter ATP-binding protein [Butyrivibrio sp. NC3005]|uniref:ABC transporter ATP-binding protein n=1 Tax=Butyrivibrio sp. NC3005 TaxID=1280685 RepID=UPI0004215382|nr:ABC transporter ATP-binding protein [Butyrivibrio sp. NC3005]